MTFPEDPIPHLKTWCPMAYIFTFQHKDILSCVNYVMGNNCLWPQWRFFGFRLKPEWVAQLNGCFCCVRAENSSTVRPFLEQFLLWPVNVVSGSARRNLEKVVRALTAPQTPLVVGNVARGGSCPPLASLSQCWTQAFSWERCSAIILMGKKKKSRLFLL